MAVVMSPVGPDCKSGGYAVQQRQCAVSHQVLHFKLAGKQFELRWPPLARHGLLISWTLSCTFVSGCIAGTAAVRLFMDTKNVRAWPGGSGEHKIGGNYAPTVVPQMAALAQHKCSQVRSPVVVA